MENKWETQYVDLQQLQQISRGDVAVILRYLNQFVELIPPRLEQLTTALDKEDRPGIRMVVHQMIPQLQFFGVPDVLPLIQSLEHEYETMELDQMSSMVNSLLHKIELAHQEVQTVFAKNSN